MSRSGYSDDFRMDDNWAAIRYRGSVSSAIKGKRGQDFIRELIAALEGMPEKKLIGDELQANGEVCALGCVGAKRGIDMSDIDPEDYEVISIKLGIAESMAREIMYENDEFGSPARRWEWMMNWAKDNLREVRKK